MELTLDQALQKGIEAHKAGKAQEADRYYTAILKANPKHPDANHNMGVLAVDVGKVEEALPFFKKALEANSSIAQYWLSYISALIELDRMADAKAVLEQAKSKVAKRNVFDQVEKQINASSENLNAPEPSQKELQSLINLYTQGHYQEALNEATKLLIKFPNSINLYNIIGAANKGLSKLEKAIEAYIKAISIKPDYADAYNNMGLALQEQSKLEEAIEAYIKAISIKPDYADAYNNMGFALQEQGKLEKAIEAYTKAISIKSNHAEAYYNTGNALQEQSKLEEAIEAYTKAISIKPNYAKALNNLGNALKNQGKLEKAIEVYTKVISNEPDYADAYKNIGVILSAIVFNRPNRGLQKTIISLLDKKKYIKPKAIAKAAISLLKLEPTLQKHLKLVDGHLIKNPLDVISDLSELPLLMKLMSVCPLLDLELEKLFKDLRCSILSNISILKEASPQLISVQSALALQCFTNEYIYNHTEEEKEALQSLEVNLKKVFKKNEQPSPHMILTIASYKSLNQYDWCKLLVVTDDIQEVYARQVKEPNAEEKLKQDLPILEEIRNKVSSKVRRQYEASPYPRWFNLDLSIKPVSISKVVEEINLELHDRKINEIEEPYILIAGCGTGQHSIGTASRFKSSNVLAIDLSLSSLAYAKRKTDEFAIKNIEYMQADILDLCQLNKQFDIIESAGVLHHMDNPMAGWKVLTDCLKPGGLMQVGLYSELARQHIVKIREEIRQAGIGLSAIEMRYFRSKIIKSEKDHHKQILSFPDFYSLSELKDLLFHVQEHRFTIPLIKEHLSKLGLHFCGFEQNDIVSHFTQTNKGNDDRYDLDKWQAYEEANPRAFVGMYQFWCQKAA